VLLSERAPRRRVGPLSSRRPDAAGDPVIQIPKNLLANLPPGKSVALTLRFSDPKLIRFGYTTEVFSDPSGS
jgi:hypothetical protein